MWCFSLPYSFYSSLTSKDTLWNLSLLSSLGVWNVLFSVWLTEALSKSTSQSLSFYFLLQSLISWLPCLVFCPGTEMYAAAAKSLQSCPTLCDPIDGSPPGSPIPGILQARTLEWVAISFSNEWKWKVKVILLSCVQLLVTPWTTAHQAPPSMGFSRQESWSGASLPSPAEMYIEIINCETSAQGRKKALKSVQSHEKIRC